MRTIIILFVFTIHSTWEIRSPSSDNQMTVWSDLDGCGQQADALMLRDGTVRGWVCFDQGNPIMSMFPPYDWPKLLIPKECDIGCMMEGVNDRQRIHI